MLFRIEFIICIWELIFCAVILEEDTREKGKLYKPQSRLSELADKLTTAERAQEYARLLGDRKPDRPGKKRDREKKKSNLELFKEELKL